MSTKIKLLFVAMAYLFTGCQSDYKLVGAVESPDPGVLVPEIEVDPLSHDFGALSAGTETHNFSVSVRNIGNGDLDISNVYLDGGLSNFTLTSVPSGIVEPMSETEIVNVPVCEGMLNVT